MSERPRQREGIEINQAADGYVVYDEARDRVHYLNHTAAIVLELCTGEQTEAEIVALMQRAFDLPEPPEIEVGECLALLVEEGLVA